MRLASIAILFFALICSTLTAQEGRKIPSVNVKTLNQETFNTADITNDVARDTKTYDGREVSKVEFIDTMAADTKVIMWGPADYDFESLKVTL